MEHNKKDIGALFEEKLQKKEAKLNSLYWQEIETSLTQRKQKRKKRLWIFTIGMGLFIIIISIFNLPYSEKKQKPNIEKSVSAPVLLPLNKEQKIADKADSINNLFKKEAPKKSVETNATVKKHATKTTVLPSKEDTVLQNSHSNKTNFNSFKKKTVYRYYNSKDSTLVETTNKDFIDSLLKIEEKQIMVDSTN